MLLLWPRFVRLSMLPAALIAVVAITVCGHSGCGAVRALMAGNATGDLGRWLSLSGTRFPGESDEGVVHVARQLENLRTYPAVTAADGLTLKGLYFDLAEARMYEVDAESGVARPVVQGI
ncbi:carbonic anhydrase [Actinoplanes sp. NPDC051513]|uniref:carbonic anhydrase n=1 Tax=Actinoplanes sp. NPDC051513 TaxID=3363908 RepID=UPI0037A5BC53